MSDMRIENHPDAGVRRTAPGLSRVVPTALVAMALSGLVWVLAAPVGGVDLVVGSGGDAQTVGLPSILVVSAVVVFAGALTRRLLARRSRGVLVWNVVAGVALLLSLAGPAGAATSDAWLALSAMHLVVGAVVLAGQRWTAGPARGGVA
jgi:hypothetical protein